MFRKIFCLIWLPIAFAFESVDLYSQEVRKSPIPLNQSDPATIQTGQNRSTSITGSTTQSSLVDFGILSGRVHNNQISKRFIECGELVKQSSQALTAEQIVELLQVKKQKVEFSIPELPVKETIQYEDLVKASLLLGTIYDCGRCNQVHENVAGGVVISTDGLALTNYHVLNQNQSGTLAMFGMTFDGAPRPVLEVLFADEVADIALIRLGGDAAFYPVPIARELPRPLDAVTVLSHPKQNYFVLTTGVVSRHVTLQGRKSVETWTEITAEYAGGSSGSGVFDSKGALIGLVSQNAPLPRIVSHRRNSDDSPNRNTYYEMTLRRCVSLEAIQSCFNSASK